MDASQLERLIFNALALTVRAQQQAAPVIDLCFPGMVDEFKRMRLAVARGELDSASMYLRSAMEQVQEASRMIADFLNPEPRLAGTDNSDSPDSKKEGEGQN